MVRRYWWRSINEFASSTLERIIHPCIASLKNIYIGGFDGSALEGLFTRSIAPAFENIVQLLEMKQIELI
jgi:hypothetical protein